MEGLSSGLLVIFVCLVLCAFFSLTETALTSISHLKAKHLRENGGSAGKVLDLWLHTPEQVLASILIGNTFVTLFSAVYAAHLAATVFDNPSIGAIALAMTVVVVMFGEIIPKTIGKTYAAQLAIPSLRLFRVFNIVLFPLALAFSHVARLLTSVVVSKHLKSPPQITEEELEFLINVSEEEGVIAEQKHEMLSGIFELGDTVVREIMVHRIDMTAVSSALKISEVSDIMRETGLSRLPVYDQKVDNIVGVIYAKDVLFFINKHRTDQSFWNAPVLDLKREAIFVPETKAVDQLFQELRKQRLHMAIVLDEYGGTSGVVTMEDILEEIVGEVRDEFDNEEDAIRPSTVANEFLVECKIHIDDFCDFFDLNSKDIMQEGMASEFDTLGGLILHHFGQIPKRGDKLNIQEVALEVVEVSRRRVRRVVARVKAPKEGQAMGLKDAEGIEHSN